MFSYQIQSLRRGVIRTMEMHQPPEECWIRKDQAEYLGVEYYRGSIYAADFPEPDPDRIKLPATTRSEPLVCVKVVDLFEALKDARGVEIGVDAEKWRNN